MNSYMNMVMQVSRGLGTRRCEEDIRMVRYNRVCYVELNNVGLGKSVCGR